MYENTSLLSYDKILNFVISENKREVLNEYLKYVVNRFLKHQEQFIYVKRNKELLKDQLFFFRELNKYFPDCSFTVNGYQFYINKQLAGWAIPLSNYQNEKSNSYPGVTTILYDGFLRHSDSTLYLKEEPKCLLNLMDTVFRHRNNGICICFDNHLDYANPYFLYFGIVPDNKKRFNVYENVLVEISNKKIKGVIQSNQYDDKNNVIIYKRTEESEYYCTLDYKNYHISFYYDYFESIMFCCLENNMRKEVYCVNDHALKDYKHGKYLRFIGKCFKYNRLLFENKEARKVCYQILNKMDLR